MVLTNDEQALSSAISGIKYVDLMVPASRNVARTAKGRISRRLMQ